MKEYVLQVTGMSCKHCQNRIEKAVSVLPGVKQATVNLEEAQLSISGEDNVDVQNIIDVIDELGYNASIQA